MIQATYYAMEMKTEFAKLTCHGLECSLIASVNTVYLLCTNNMYIFDIGVTVTVDNSIDYMVNEASGSVSITLLLDQQSCRPVIIIAHPRVRSLVGDHATGSISYLTVSPLQ